MATSLDATARQAAVNAIVDLLDSGTVEIRSGSAADPDSAATGTVLATISLAATAFNSATDDGTTATATAQGTLEDTSADATGTAAHFVAKQSGGNVLLTGTVTATGGGGDMELNTVSITALGTVTITSWTVTCGQTQS